jgi:putative inorganic carbon (hco3(-)) transporter
LLHQQLSRLVLAVVAVAFVYLLVTRRRTLTLPRSGSALLLGLLLAASLVSWLLTRAPGSTNSVLDIALYPLMALLFANLALTEQDHARTWTALLGSALLVALVGGFLFATGTHIWTPNPAVANRLNITFADPNITARFLTLGACAAVLLFASRKAPTWLSTATALGCGIVLPMTLSRSGLALFIVGVVVAVAFSFDRRRATAIGALALLAFAVSTAVNPETRQRALEATGTVASAITGTTHNVTTAAASGQDAVALEDNRKYLVAAGLSMFAGHPITGVGFGGYQHQLLTAYRHFLPPGYTDSVSHTSFVTVMAEQGMIGTLLLVAFLFQLAREALASRRRGDPWAPWAALPAMLVVPIFLFSQFEARFLQEPYLWLSLAMLYSAQAMSLRTRRLEAAVLSAEPRARPLRSIEVA